jgi:ribosomal protein S16
MAHVPSASAQGVSIERLGAVNPDEEDGGVDARGGLDVEGVEEWILDEEYTRDTR